ncbi:MAG: NADPH:quinone oxidoreductase family protein [Hyphomicrobiales bacterium]|nr:NADPH:quinone oxidoreductase family protein [Hyphomicrobiales bacterium]
MRAILSDGVSGIGGLTLSNVAVPAPGPGEVAVCVSAVALNFFDTLVVQGKYQHRPTPPFSPGGEIAGVVSALGAGVTEFVVGQRVMAYVKFNGCREVSIANASDLISIPDGVTDEVAAGLTITYGTALHGLGDRAKLAAGEMVAVLGASGGAGLAAVEVAKLMGARVIAAASSPEKLAICRAHGADEVVDYETQDLKDTLKALTAGRGVDVVYDCVGGPHAEAALRAMAWEGRYLVVGFAGGGIPSIPLNLLLLKGCALLGVFFGEFAARHPERYRANMERALSWVASGALKPHIHDVMPLEKTAEALTLLAERKVTGKLIIRV